MEVSMNSIKYLKYFPVFSIIYLSAEAAEVAQDPLHAGDFKRKNISTHSESNKQLKVKDSLRTPGDNTQEENNQWKEEAYNTIEFLDEQERLESGEYNQDDADLE